MWSAAAGASSRFGSRLARPRVITAIAQRSSAAPIVETASSPPVSPWNSLDDGHPWRPGGHSPLQSVWGTAANPVPIASSGDSRLVACSGEPLGQLHDVEWIEVRRGTLSSCPKCNQVFKLISKN